MESSSDNETRVRPVRPAAPHAFVGVVEDGSIPRERGVAAALRRLGADVRTVGLRDEPRGLLGPEDDELGTRARALIIESIERTDLALDALRAVRRVREFDNVGVLVAMGEGHVARVEPSAGFDDFIVFPYAPEELYARVRAVEWRRSEFETEERHKVGSIVLDKGAREVTVGGRRVAMTIKEFSLLAYLCERRGRVLSRDQLLARVWGRHYRGGPRTVDIHVRRLRMKLGDSLPLETLRGWGYRLNAPAGQADSVEDLESYAG